MRQKITELKQQRAGLIEEAREIIVTAESEDRDLTGEERGKLEGLEGDIESLGERAGRLEKMAGLDHISQESQRSITGDEEQRDGGAGDEEQREFAENYGAWATRELGGDMPMDDPEYREQFYAWLAMGDPIQASEEVRSMIREFRVQSKATSAAGAALVPTTFERSVIKYARDFGVIESLATVITTASGEQINYPRVTSYGAAAWTAENASFNESDDAFDTTPIGAYKATRIVRVSEELLADSAFDLEAHLQESLGESFGILKNTALVLGDGSGKPKGFLTDVTGITAPTGNVTSLPADSFFDLFHAVKPAYRRNGTWVLNDASIKTIRKLKDTTGQYLWQPGLQAGVPDTLLSRPVEFDPDMPDMAANAKSVAFGDFKRAYLVRNARGLALQRLVEKYADNGQVGFRGYIRTDGRTVDANAVKYLANSAT